MIRFSPDLRGDRGEFVSCQSKIGQRACSPGWGERPRLCSPCPVGLQQRGVVDNGRKQCGEGPQQECGEELADDRVLQDKYHHRGSRWRWGCSHCWPPEPKLRWVKGGQSSNVGKETVITLCGYTALRSKGGTSSDQPDEGGVSIPRAKLTAAICRPGLLSMWPASLLHGV